MSTRMLHYQQQQRRLARAAVSAGVATIGSVLYYTNVEPLSEQKRNAIVAPVYGLLERLRTGNLDLAGYDMLIEANGLSFCLAAELHNLGTEDTKTILEPSEGDILAAADVMSSIGERFNRTGKFGATGDEMRILRTGFEWYGQMLMVCTEGHVYRASEKSMAMLAEFRKQLANKHKG